jgi:Ala-tRNA(Pro) deacylase
MAIALSLHEYLHDHGVHYETLLHERTQSAAQAAHSCSLSETSVAKGVLLRNENGYLLAVVPASSRVEIEALSAMLNQPIALASELEASAIFGDCEIGCVPALAEPYDLMAIVDDGVDAQEDIYFEGGDHRTLVHMRGDDYRRLMSGASHAHISAPPTASGRGRT